jgi:hypothetical protein
MSPAEILDEISDTTAAVDTMMVQYTEEKLK